VKCICMGLAALVFAVFGTETALAQPASPGNAAVDLDNSSKLSVSVVLPADRQEEVEILRRLLDKSFEAVYGRFRFPMGHFSSAGMGGNSDSGWTGMLVLNERNFDLSDHPATPLEGVYLKDYGVVYTITLPPPPNQMSPGPSAGAVTQPALSPWERTRKELRGEKIEDERKGTVGSPSLSDVILKVLADNGKHFTRLAEGEQITVAVTFRGAMNCASCHETQNRLRLRLTPSGGSTGGPPQGMAPALGAFFSFDGRGAESADAAGSHQIDGASSSGGLTPSSGSADAPGDFAAWLTDVRNAVRLGELHLKRGKSQDAITAYKEALARLEKEMLSRRSATMATGVGVTAGDVPVLLVAVDLCNKMAQVYAQMGDVESGRAMIQRASKLAKQAEQLTGTAAEANPRPSTPALPSKLIVTASKKLLDEVGSGKTSFETFRKAATVEYVKPPVADKK
jgi:hypothetical protein